MSVGPPPQSFIVPPWVFAVAAMGSVQLGSALSVPLIESVGPAGTAWLRLSFGAVIFLAVARPRAADVRRRDAPALLVLGVVTGLMTVSFLAAIERIPLGTSVAIEFLGPLTVAAVRSRTARALLWPLLALVGVVLLTQPWRGEINAVGVAFAAVSAVGWGSYILLTQHVGDRYTGVTGLSLTIPVAAATAAVAGIPQARGHVDAAALVAAFGLALLLPVLPFTLEMLALRSLTPTAFGTLMALEPAFAVLLGLLLLDQVPAPSQIAGICLVVLAGAAAQYGGQRRGAPHTAAPHGEPNLVG